MSYEVDYIPWLERQKERLTFKYNKIKSERDTLIDDIAVLKVNISRLERENEKLRNESIKNYKLWEESEEQERYFVKEFNKYHNLYTTLTNHIRDMKFASPYSYNYIHLVNFIKELERADDER
ncbi:hypothetical protein BJG88_08745 [Staphylococcus nepalensis]|uniref:hypothetical protein n=1 Tax=Staphylococcus nepalensis TaxID=214473 RepID=UPI000D589D0E|nr:hypothetical protein [Staphylococcus nepalensis]AWI44820.1 hypothetical protein BJG88_08745 [Staphylococcus nepalensis]